MKQGSLTAIRGAFKYVLGEILNLPQLPEESRWVYRRIDDGGWSGQLISKPSMAGLLAREKMNTAASEIREALEQDYPEYLQAFGTTLSRGPLQPITIPLTLVREAYERFGTFVLTDEQIEEILGDMSSFFDRMTVGVRLCAPALNLRGSRKTPQISLPGGITLRPITDEECTTFYGGNPIFQLRRSPLLPDFVFVQDVEVPKVFGVFDDTQVAKGDPIIERFQYNLDLCILALATFKNAGPVGYDGVRFRAREFTMGHIFNADYFNSSEHVPFGSYSLSPEEATKMGGYSKMFEQIHPTLEMACRRLVDSTRRAKQQDAVVDAVIGLESILLSNISPKTELSFRFSLRYASFFPTSKRKDAFRVAKDLYDLRSTIVHGDSINQQAKINGKGFSLGEAAEIARSVLRETISRFTSESKSPQFLQTNFWTSRELDLNAQTAESLATNCTEAL